MISGKYILEISVSIFDEIMSNRGYPSQGYNPQRWVELVDGEEVPMMFHEPDPQTHRTKYYYNSRTNQLKKKIETAHPLTGADVIYWKTVNDY